MIKINFHTVIAELAKIIILGCSGHVIPNDLQNLTVTLYWEMLRYNKKENVKFKSMKHFYHFLWEHLRNAKGGHTIYVEPSLWASKVCEALCQSKYNKVMNMINDIVGYTVLNEYEPENIILESCIFKKDFGPWKKGQFAKYITFQFMTGMILEHNDQKHLVRECNIGLVVLEK